MFASNKWSLKYKSVASKKGNIVAENILKRVIAWKPKKILQHVNVLQCVDVYKVCCMKLEKKIKKKQPWINNILHGHPLGGDGTMSPENLSVCRSSLGIVGACMHWAIA